MRCSIPFPGTLPAVLSSVRGPRRRPASARGVGIFPRIGATSGWCVQSLYGPELTLTSMVNYRDHPADLVCSRTWAAAAPRCHHGPRAQRVGSTITRRLHDRSRDGARHTARDVQRRLETLSPFGAEGEAVGGGDARAPTCDEAVRRSELECLGRTRLRSAAPTFGLEEADLVCSEPALVDAATGVLRRASAPSRPSRRRPVGQGFLPRHPSTRRRCGASARRPHREIFRTATPPDRHPRRRIRRLPASDRSCGVPHTP